MQVHPKPNTNAQYHLTKPHPQPHRTTQLQGPQTYAQKGFTNLVTRKENDSESQIDYMLIPQHKKGKAYVSKSTDEEPKSDHRPIVLHIEDEPHI